MKTLIALILATQLSGCITLGYQGWIAAHTTEIGQVALVAGAISSVESAALNTKAIVEEVKK